MISLAFSVYSNPGVYALLLGSGMSRSSGILTGWEITLDLIRKIAALEKADCADDPANWYRQQYGKNPDYSDLLDNLVKTGTERSQLLKPYFEPNEDEQANKIKYPTQAHNSIAELVKSGYIKVIITTNFDHLIETAIRSKGIEPTIISTPDAAEGMLPLTHNNCAIIKVNGDYIDCRIKNTAEELDHYDDRVNKLLDQVLDEFGLLVCGWSGEWDIALRGAFQRCKTHRFTTYWCVRDRLHIHAQDLVTLRGANIVEIKEADSFFTELEDKVKALKDIEGNHPISAKLATAIVKRYIVDETSRIKLHDFAHQEIEKLYFEINSDRFPVQFSIPFSSEEASFSELRNRLLAFEKLSEVSLNILVTGCYWGADIHRPIWVSCLEKICNQPIENNVIIHFMNARLYPGLILHYAAGMASLANGHYDSFAACIREPRVYIYSQDKPLEYGLFPDALFDNAVANKAFPTGNNLRVAVSEHLMGLLREPFRDIIQNDNRYMDIFDLFEYLRALIYYDVSQKKDYPWYPQGRFIYKHQIMTELDSDINKAGADWPLLKLGFFDNSLERLLSIKAILDSEAKRRGLG